MDLPEAFSECVKRTFGEAGIAWLAGLPDLLDKLSKRWSLRLGPHFPELNYNYLAPALRDDGQSVVLKVGVPNPELTSEIEALRHYCGNGAVNLISSDQPAGALLLEHVKPGNPAQKLDDDQRATEIAAEVINRLHRPTPQGTAASTIADWGQGFQRLRSHFNGGTGPFPLDLVHRAETYFRDLLLDQGAPVLLHADLHQWNILSSGPSSWVAIDPKGLIGEREYEAGAWLRNPMPYLLEWPNAAEILNRRVDQFVDLLGFDRGRTIAWSFYQAVLAAWWSYEESDPGWEDFLGIATLITKLP